jgi:hypothetical protein
MRQGISGNHQAVAARNLYGDMTRCMSGAELSPNLGDGRGQAAAV